MPARRVLVRGGAARRFRDSAGRCLAVVRDRWQAIDWAVRDDVRAMLRCSIKWLLVQYKYPPGHTARGDRPGH
ncbi:type I restriction enzyme endonuclease domain-containing protein [Micromonospora sp. NPDC006431]|uniref:type I restriction enzyme endonuclease domain-containing protein n=1 Tax=Micromonospora sp. NPDC006431 TaxID=3364235 RepID=UPI0036A1EA96